MHIIHIASELAPLAKVGGLADVLLGLCRELSWKGHDVDIIIPKYDCLDSNEIRDMSVAYTDLMSYYDGNWFPNTVWMGWVENLRVYFIDTHHPRHFFDRGCFYGCDDDIERYLYFSRTAFEFLFKKPIRPDIIHLHDWQTAIIPTLSKDMYQQLGFTSAKYVFTVHNFEYQGKCSPHNLDKIGLDSSRYITPESMQDPFSPDIINLLKGGVVSSDFVTTVSPNYAKEVLTPEGGKGLENTLIKNQDKFQGILNGVDYSYWNPEIDRYLPVHYSPREMPESKKDRNTLDKKAFMKKLFREKMMLAEDYRPLVGSVTRLVPQKGIELIKHAIEYILSQNGQFALLGSTTIPEIMSEFQALKHYYADHPHVHITLHHQEELAHMIFAASDMFIVPSLFEPCGLTQLIGLKYGAVPIVRRTGGLADTIFDVDLSGKPFNETNGYTFDDFDLKQFESALSRAIHCWFQEPDKWRKLMINGMNNDYSWDRSSNQYLEIYRNLKNHSGSSSTTSAS